MLQCREAKGYLGACGGIGKVGIVCLPKTHPGLRSSVLFPPPGTSPGSGAPAGASICFASSAGGAIRPLGYPRFAAGGPSALRACGPCQCLQIYAGSVRDQRTASANARPQAPRNVVEGIAPRTQARMGLRKTRINGPKARKAERPPAAEGGEADRKRGNRRAGWPFAKKLAGAGGLEPTTLGFGDRCSTN